MIHITHIQNTAPAPPRQIAVDTPTIFPVPTREAVETIRAWKDETLLPSSFFGGSMTRPQACLKRRICTNFVLNVK